MRIGVVGAGAWGTTMAVHLARNGHEVVLWTRDAARAARMQETRENEKYLPSIRFPEHLEVTAGEVGGCEVLAGAVPTQHMRAVFERLRDQLPLAPFVSLTKGVEVETGALPTQIYRQEVGDDRPTAVLTGPCIGHEVASGLPTAVVIAGDEAHMLQDAFRSDRFRVYTSTDRVGAELSAALKNVLAIAAGIVDGMQLGDNIKAALLTRGIVELARLGVALGADARTFTGLAGFGDLFTTCVSPHSRNRSVGERIGQGEKLDAILESMDSEVEGVPTTRAILTLAGAMGVEMPITAALADILFKDIAIEDALGSLMRRDVRSE